MSDRKVIDNIIGALDARSNGGTKPYDTAAKVVRVDGSTAWVEITPGTETPVKRAIDCRAGDTVQVRVAGGSAWLTGNHTAPPTDDKTAKAAKAVANDAGIKAVKATETADEAKTQALSTASHFWLDAAGQANVSDTANDAESGSAVTIGSKGIVQRCQGKVVQAATNTALNYYNVADGSLAATYTPHGMGVFASGHQVSSMTRSGVMFYDGSGSTETANVLASFGNDGVVIGKQASGSIYTTVSPTGFAIWIKE